MFHYKNEAMFSKAFVQALRNRNWFVQRIESGETGKGIPDIYAIAPNGTPFWFELKRVHIIANSFNSIGIPWRPGQQAWLMKARLYKQKVFTIACCNNVILKISHDSMHKNNLVRMYGPGVETYESIASLFN